MPNHEAVIVSGARTAIGTAYKGSLVDVDALELGTVTVAEAVRRSGIAPELVDDVVMGESLYGGGDIGRYAAIEAGLVNAPGIAHNRHCASGLAAVQSAAASIIAGMDRVVVAGGVQSSSTPPKTSRRVPGTGEVEEDWLAPSHRETPDAPIRDMTITVGWKTAVKAIPKALGRAGLSAGDVALGEINEAFASVSVAATRALGLDEDIVNVLGSGCSLGHPVAMTGARMVLTLIYELRRRGGGVGVTAMCAGGGMATALVLDVPDPA